MCKVIFWDRLKIRHLTVFSPVGTYISLQGHPSPIIFRSYIPACGPDELTPKILKLVALLIYEPLTRLYNKCLEAGVYPSIWKRPNIHPVFKKKGSPSDPTNYRPISLLPCLSKLFGKTVFKHIYQHLTDHQTPTSLPQTKRIPAWSQYTNTITPHHTTCIRT